MNNTNFTPYAKRGTFYTRYFEKYFVCREYVCMYVQTSCTINTIKYPFIDFFFFLGILHIIITNFFFLFFLRWDTWMKKKKSLGQFRLLGVVVVVVVVGQQFKKINPIYLSVHLTTYNIPNFYIFFSFPSPAPRPSPNDILEENNLEQKELKFFFFLFFIYQSHSPPLAQ